MMTKSNRILADRFDIHFSSKLNMWPFLTEEFSKIDNIIDCGLGIPNFSTSQFIINETSKSLMSNKYNQYGNPFGEVNLRKNLATIYQDRYILKTKSIDITFENIQISFGASGAFDIICRAFLNENDEVVTIQPFWIQYLQNSAHFGAKLKTVNMDLEYNKNTNEWNWSFDTSKLKKVFNDKTKLFVLNTPHNPTGFVMSFKKMKEIELILKDYPNILVVADEVYEYMIYNNKKHISFASISNEMFERTITISSVSKTFAVTGWRLGWIITTKKLIKLLFPSSFSHCGPGNHLLQHSMGNIVNIAYNDQYQGELNYFEWLNKFYCKKHKLIIDAISESGCNSYLNAIIPDGSFYVIVEVTKCIQLLSQLNILNKNNAIIDLEWQFVVWFAKNIRIGVAPLTGFCLNNQQFIKNRYFVRIAYPMDDQQLIEIKTRFAKISKLITCLENGKVTV